IEGASGSSLRSRGLIGSRERMSKKNNLAKREKQHEYNLQKEKELQDKKIKKLQANKNKMKVDGSGKKKKGGFSVGKKKLKTKLTPASKAKAAQAMELDN
ncbi:unnamed protein product, partial [Brassica oleracea var. botrytis]